MEFACIVVMGKLSAVVVMVGEAGQEVEPVVKVF